MFNVPHRFRLPVQFYPPEYLSLRDIDPEKLGNNGYFLVPACGRVWNVVASDGGGWEHVSVSRPGPGEVPTWAVMCAIKDLFWGPEDVAVQIHPPHSEYVNHHPNCLHLWRKSGTNDFMERPPAIFVGPQNTTKGEKKNDKKR